MGLRMLSSIVCILIGLGIGGLAFLLISKWRDVGFAYLVLCWVPIVALSAAYLVRERLGYSALAILMAVTVASLGLVALGVGLSVRARQMGLRDANRIVVGTVVAGIPALIVIAVVCWTKAR